VSEQQLSFEAREHAARPPRTPHKNAPLTQNGQSRTRELFMRSLQTLALAATMLAAATVHSQTLGNTSTYSGLTWDVSTNAPGVEACTRLFLDATGDVSQSNQYAAYGQLFCPALSGGYASHGAAYFDSAGSFHMTVNLGITYQMVCDYLSGSSLSGSCPVYNYQGTQVGTATVTFL
jgi:hypothetical protein